MRASLVIGVMALALHGVAHAQAPDPGGQGQAEVAAQLARALSQSAGENAKLQAQVAQLQAQLKAAQDPPKLTSEGKKP